MTINIFFFNDTATTEIYTLSLHDALPISRPRRAPSAGPYRWSSSTDNPSSSSSRSEEHTSELQSRRDLVCRLLLEKKKWTGMGRDKLRQYLETQHNELYHANIDIPKYVAI